MTPLHHRQPSHPTGLWAAYRGEDARLPSQVDAFVRTAEWHLGPLGIAVARERDRVTFTMTLAGKPFQFMSKDVDAIEKSDLYELVNTIEGVKARAASWREHTAARFRRTLRA